MKKYIAMLMCLLMVLLTACGNEIEKIDKEKDQSMFVLVEGDATSLWWVVYNKDTKVMYTISRGSYNSGNFTLLVNADGTPMLWEE